RGQGVARPCRFTLGVPPGTPETVRASSCGPAVAGALNCTPIVQVPPGATPKLPHEFVPVTKMVGFVVEKTNGPIPTDPTLVNTNVVIELEVPTLKDPKS